MSFVFAAPSPAGARAGCRVATAWRGRAGQAGLGGGAPEPAATNAFARQLRTLRVVTSPATTRGDSAPTGPQAVCWANLIRPIRGGRPPSILSRWRLRPSPRKGGCDRRILPGRRNRLAAQRAWLGQLQGAGAPTQGAARPVRATGARASLAGRSHCSRHVTEQSRTQRPASSLNGIAPRSFRMSPSDAASESATPQSSRDLLCARGTVSALWRRSSAPGDRTGPSRAPPGTFRSRRRGKGGGSPETHGRCSWWWLGIPRRGDGGPLADRLASLKRREGRRALKGVGLGARRGKGKKNSLRRARADH